MKVSYVVLAGLALTALSAAAQLQVQTTQVGPTPGANPPGTGAPAPRPTPLPCPGMAGLEVGQTRTFSFERMALHEPAKKTVTRDLKVLHTPEGRPWTVDVTYASDALDAKVVALHYLLDPPSGLYEGILERYGKGNARRVGTGRVVVGRSVLHRSVDGSTPALPDGHVGKAAPRGGALGGAPDGEKHDGKEALTDVTAR